ncbi:transcriptional regulator, SarA/Rot family [Macrococcus capreoli]|uniref:transcriptional regulator, SarA/Rot family n=1 Tax=Macrococcus capreoli TaxID=2982690 RepID=UPI003EE77B36
MNNVQFLLASNMLNKEIEYMINSEIKKEFGITAKDLLILECLYQDENITLSQLLKRKEFKRMALAVRVKDLVKRGIIDKERSTTDERHVYIKLSTEGLILFAKIKEKVENDYNIEKLIEKFMSEFQNKMSLLSH